MLTYIQSLPEQYLDFFSKFNVLGLAIGLMIGSNLKDVANDFIKIVNENNRWLSLFKT